MLAVCQLVAVAAILIGAVPGIALAANYNDNIDCNASNVSITDERAALRFGSCIPYQHWSRPTPCDFLYTPDVDYFFLPWRRTQNNPFILASFAADINVVANTIEDPCRDAAVRGLCYFYFPPCGNSTHFEPPNSLCSSTCQYVTEDLCRREWEAALAHFDSIHVYLTYYQIDVLNCSQPSGLLEPFPHCCTDAGIVEYIEPTTQVDPPQLESPQSNTTTIASVVTSVVLLMITIAVVAVIVYVAVKRFGGSKVVLQVTGDSIDVLDGAKLPVIILQRDSETHLGEELQREGGSITRYISEHVLDHSLHPQSSTRLEVGDMRMRPRLPSVYLRQIAQANLLIKSEQIKLLDSVGQGEFGVVYRGHVTGLPNNSLIELVAIKTLKATSTSSQKEVADLIEESLKMKSFHHLNVLNLIGVCIDAGPAPYLVMPYMLNGSLLSYLRKERPKLTIAEGATEDLVVEAKKKLLAMCLQIAKGMEYLAQQKFVHRDLAARNCMIDDNFVIKVADFGLAEDIYCKDYFRQVLSGNAQGESVVKLPIKWMALESLSDGIFTEKTDVWSFGVTCWEVFSLGRSPYPGVDPFTLIKYLEEGKRLVKPNNAACTDNVYDVMSNCWTEEPERRPSFAELVQTLTSLLEDIAAYMDFSILTNSECPSFVNYDHLYARAPSRDEAQKGYDHLEQVQ